MSMLELRYDLFNDSKYTRWYYHIINNARTQNRTKSDGSYYERHHIVPKSLGGNEANANKVLLTFKEHFICHWLLTKMVDEKEHFWKMNSALNRMASINSSSLVGRVLLSWQFVRARQASVDAMKGRVFSDEHRVKMSASATGRVHSDETRVKISTSQIGRVLSAEHRAKMSASAMGRQAHNKGKVLSNEHRAKLSASLTGRFHSDETRAKMSASLTGRVRSDEHRAKLSASHTGKVLSDETRAKMSASSMKVYYFYDPENNHITVDNLQEFCKNKDIVYRQMRSLYNGSYRSNGKILTTYKGWRSANPALIGEAIAA